MRQTGVIAPPHRLCAVFAASLYLATYGAHAAQLAEVPLLGEGQTNFSIVLAKDAGEFAKFAASELVSYLRKLTGVEPDVVRDSDAAARPAGQTFILLSSTANSITRELQAGGVLSTNNLKREGFSLKTLSWKGHPVVAIAGADDAGTLYGGYELLERLGITFRLTGDLVPAPQPKLKVPALDGRMEPAMHRRGFLFAVEVDNVSAFSWPDYELFLDQMARMKCNYLIFWWFEFSPWLKFSYRGETKLMGDVARKESGYMGWYYGGFGSHTVDDVTIGREHFKDRPRVAPIELQKVESPEEAFQICQDMLRRIIAHAAKRNIKVWPAVELASVPPNLARFGEMVGSLPFDNLMGTFLHPLDPVNREIQVSRLKALAETYPQAEGYFLNFAEVYPELDNAKHRDFFEQQRPRFHELQNLSVPYAAGLAHIYDMKIGRRLIDSNAGYLDLFNYLLNKRDEVAPRMKVGLMTVGRGYALPVFNKLIPPDVPFASLESSGVWTMQGVPMQYFGDMGARERIIQPRIDDDFDMLGMQFNVRQYADKDRIFSDGVKYGVSGVAGQVERVRGTEFNSSFIAQASWNPQLTPSEFYRQASERMFGKEAANAMHDALMKLEEHQEYLGYYEYDSGYGVMLCCSGIREVTSLYRYWRQKNIYGGPIVGSWKRLIAGSPEFIAYREGAIRLLNEALAHMEQAAPKVASHGKYELRYLINRTEVYRDCFAGLNTWRRGLMQFDAAFRVKENVSHEEFVTQLESSLATLVQARGQLKAATEKFSLIIDHVSDLAVLYTLNARVLLGTDLAFQLLENVVNYHRGKPYLKPVPFERLYPPRPDEGNTE